MPRRAAVLAWLVVVLVGALVLGIIFNLNLFTRLSAGQRVTDGLKPVFAPSRATGDRAGINMVNTVIAVADPFVTPEGGVAAEVPKLVALIASKSGKTDAQVLAVLESQFPHTAGLLESAPLTEASKELNGFVSFVATALKTTPADVVNTLKANFPHLAQVVTALPVVTSSWNNIPGNMTRFDGTKVSAVPQVGTYFSQDVVPVVEHHQLDFGRVATYFPPVKYVAPILAAVGAIAILFGLIMMLRAAGGRIGRSEGTAEWTVVALLGVIVVALVFGAQFFPRLTGANKLLTDARPVFTPDRVAGDRASVTVISAGVDLLDPIMTPQGGAEAEVTQLVHLVATKLNTTDAKALAAVKASFPHLGGLLQAVPLSKVNDEIPGVVSFLAKTLGVNEAHAVQAVQENFPHLAQAVIALPVAVGGWYDVPGLNGLTRFNGQPVHSVTQLRDYFSSDVVAGVEATQKDFRTLDETNPPLNFFPPLLVFLGYIVIFYGVVMIILTRLPDREQALAASKERSRSRR